MNMNMNKKMEHMALFDNQNRKRTAKKAFSKVAAPHPYGIKPGGNLYFDMSNPDFVPPYPLLSSFFFIIIFFWNFFSSVLGVNNNNY